MKRLWCWGTFNHTVNPELAFALIKQNKPWVRRLSQQVVDRTQSQSTTGHIEELQEVARNDSEWCGFLCFGGAEEHALLKTPARREGKLVATQPL